MTQTLVANGISRVALDVETAMVYGRRILEGVARYLRESRPWSVCLEQHELGQDLKELLNRWDGDGLITRSVTQETIPLLAKRGISVVDVGDIEPYLGVLRIQSADREIGQMAARHLIERGFETLACCGFSGEQWSLRRREGFVNEVRAADLTVDVRETPRAIKTSWRDDQADFVEWIQSLPKPLGVFATNDFRGHQVLDACAQINVAVPETVAVLGVDNDEVLCGFCHPPLTSIIPDSERIGYEAALSLDRLIDGEPPPAEIIEIPPLGIAVRQSSDVYAVPDPTVAAALRFIREHACQGVTVAEVVEHVDVSRSWLERHFRRYVNHSPQVEIRVVQVRRCMELLRNTALSLERIASLTGFEHPEYMSVVFKRETGETPGSYRKRHLAGK